MTAYNEEHRVPKGASVAVRWLDDFGSIRRDNGTVLGYNMRLVRPEMELLADGKRRFIPLAAIRDLSAHTICVENG